MAFEVSRKKERVIVADLIRDLLYPMTAFEKLALREVDALHLQPVDRRKPRRLFESAKKVTLA